MSSVSYNRVWDEMLSEGVVAFTTQQLVERTGAPAQTLHPPLARAQTERRLFSPALGLYVLVSPSHRAQGVVPADWWIADMAEHLGRRYYLSHLTAAAKHGARHQAAQTFQITVDRDVPDREVVGVRLRFFADRHLSRRPTVRLSGPTGPLVCATAETCVLDLATRPLDVGGIGVLLEVLPDLAVDARVLAAIAPGWPRAVCRRAGWLLSTSQPDLDLGPLAQLVQPEAGNATPLVPGGSKRGPVDRRWMVKINTKVEASL
jgi:predicted transcriptional regulator of viral defense system